MGPGLFIAEVVTQEMRDIFVQKHLISKIFIFIENNYTTIPKLCAEEIK